MQDYVTCANSRSWNSKGKNLSKYIIWAVWFAFIVSLWIRSYPLRGNFLYFVEIDRQYLIIYAIIMSIIYLFTLLTGRRGTCHSLCWMAPFMVIGEKLADLLHIPRFRLKAYPDACVSCGTCSRNCPMGLNIAEMVKSGNIDSTECINCLACVDSCPKKAIRFESVRNGTEVLIEKLAFEKEHEEEHSDRIFSLDRQCEIHCRTHSPDPQAPM